MMAKKNMAGYDAEAAKRKEAFDQNWRFRKETAYNHWVKGRPVNQIQLAFRSHWKLFAELMGGKKCGRCLEVGCGRGSISSYFAESGFDCVLIDYSKPVLQTARKAFFNNGHKAAFVLGDALALPFENDVFDVVVSIGLLEHFRDIKRPMSEQVRVLRSGGIFLGYIVPEFADNVQRYFRPINNILRIASLMFGRNVQIEKSDVFRSKYNPEHYVAMLKEESLRDVNVLGMYPLPMISHSPEFPFSLLPPMLEYILTRIFELVLWTRRLLFNRNPWICKSFLGQAFLLTFRKK